MPAAMFRPALLVALASIAACDPATADPAVPADPAAAAHSTAASAQQASALPLPASARPSATLPSGALPSSAAPGAPAAAASAPCPRACSSIERCETGQCVPACPSGEVFIPATGPDGFIMGKGMRKQNDPPHKVVLTQAFCMDATEVTVRAYQQCVTSGACQKPRPWGVWLNYPKNQDHPINKVHWKEAKTYCESRGQSLPSEAQWEWAAGGDGRDWPWGNDKPSCKHADYTYGFQDGPASDDGCHGGGTSAVASHPAGDRKWPDGALHDLAGNVWEWCLDNYRPYPRSAETDPVHLDEALGVHVVRGGGWNRSARGILVHYRGGAVADYRVPGLGFRCVRNSG